MDGSNMKIEMNGALITGRIDGLESFKVTIENKTDDNRIAKSFSSELTFYDDGFDLIKANLIDDPNGFTNSIDVTVYDSCCQEPVFVGMIRGDSIDWCDPGCSVTANLIEEEEAINCVKSTLIWDNHNGFMNQDQPAIRYCLEMRPVFIQVVILWLAFILNIALIGILIPIIAVVFVIFGIIYIICSIISAIASVIPGVSGPDCNDGWTNPINIINNILDGLDSLQDSLIGCGRFHPSPFVRDYIQNACSKCGLTFQSSILNDPASIYYNLAYMSAEVEKGRKNNSTNFKLIEGNEPLFTLEIFLSDVVAPLFAAKWEIKNGLLILEREDFFQNTATWINTFDLDQAERLIDGVVCYNWIDEDRAAFGRFEYTKDGQEYVGNEASPRFNDIVEWNDPPNPIQSGEFKFQTPTAPSRFRDDDIEVDVYSFFADALGGAVNAVFGGAFSESQYFLLMNQHTCFAGKFLLLDESTAQSTNYVRRNYNNAFTGGNVQEDGTTIQSDARFNYPLWFKEENANNLYTNFHFIRNPRNPGSQNFDFEFEFVFECDEYQDFDFTKGVEVVKSQTTLTGVVQKIEVDFVKRIIKVNGIV